MTQPSLGEKNDMNIRCQIETVGVEGPPPPDAPPLATSDRLPPIPKVAVVRL